MTSELSAHSPLPVQKAKMSPGKLPLSHPPAHTPTCNNYHIFHALGSALISLVGLEFLKHKDFICFFFFIFVSTTEEQALVPASKVGMEVVVGGSGEDSASR